MKLALVLLFAIALVGCGGYGNKSNTPPQPGTVPTISNLNPPSVVAGSGQFSLVVTGTNFNANAVVNFNGTAMTTTSGGATKLTATIPNSAIANSGNVPVTVTNPGTPGGIYGGGTSPATSVAMTFMIN
jgi:trimeric autotransporter adhesin